MARYQYAKDEQGNTVKATDLIGTQISSEYICLGCENPLVAKVNGKIKKPHFAHKALQECNGETYLHRLGKEVFYETYQKCLAENEPFYITFNVPKKCQKYKGWTATTLLDKFRLFFLHRREHYEWTTIHPRI